MFSLFRLLLKKSYWRHLSLRTTWFEAWISLRRLHKDRRARRYVRRLGFLLIIPLLCVVYLVWILQTGAVFLLIPAIPVIWWIRRNNRLNEPLHITPQVEIPKPVEMTAAQREHVCVGFGELGLFYAVMLARAGNELFVQNKQLPPNIEIISRRTHIDLLRRTGIWEKLSRADREANMMPDGHWDLTTIQHASLAMEPYRLIRWLLRIDFFLPAVGKQAKGDFDLAREIVQTPEIMLASRQFVTPDALEVALGSAKEYFFRYFAESIHRGYRVPHDENAAAWATEVATRLSGRQNDDLTIGTKLVSEADEEEIRWTTVQSHTRMTFLTWIINLANRDQTPPLPFTLLQPEPEAAPAQG
ncbi:MAG TPA: hypothetical protein VHX60_07915 [Acidobacteriaceae bacterium]|jgi:hypothetical protein|nr:hypothetical protein [Acidobacteriaceae bacterium]